MLRITKSTATNRPCQSNTIISIHGYPRMIIGKLAGSRMPQRETSVPNSTSGLVSMHHQGSLFLRFRRLPHHVFCGLVVAHGGISLLYLVSCGHINIPFRHVHTTCLISLAPVFPDSFVESKDKRVARASAGMLIAL